MRYFTNFSEALADFRESGGAMNVIQPGSGDDGPLFAVGEYEDIADTIDGSPKGATMQALYEGGMTEEEVVAELSDWTN
jgi:hypothetical protein